MRRKLAVILSGGAKDTYELADVGASMHICVGIYGDGAVDKECLIYILRHTDSPEPLGCIEVRSGMVAQAKGRFNQQLEGAELDYVSHWVAEKGLGVRTYDLPEQRTITHDEVHGQATLAQPA